MSLAEQASAPQQRSLKLRNDHTSLLWHTSDSEFEQASTETEASDDDDDEFKPATEDSENESLSENEFWESREWPSPSRERLQKLQTYPAASKSQRKVIDLTSWSNVSTPVKPYQPSSCEDISELLDEPTSAILRFSPPRTKSPYKKPASRNTCTSRTPPQSPSKSKLSSPQKLARIPPTPHHPNHVEFWDAGVVNSWNDRHSPVKHLQSPRKIRLPDSSDDESVRPKSPSPQKSPQKASCKKDSSAVGSKRKFDRDKHRIAEDFFRELDLIVTEGKVSSLAASTGGVKFIWSKKLNSTAGRAHWRREVSRKVSTCNSSTIYDGDTQANTIVQYRHHASIELAEKVIDHEERLLNVIAHEYCHLANFMISEVKDQPHGASFKRWAKLVTDAFADRNVEVTTKHTYQINYKYAWLCSNGSCAIEYARHSRSIDPKRHTCGKCKSKLVQIRPVPRKATSGDGQTQGAKGGVQSQYQTFVKENYNVVKRELGEKSPMKDVMREIGSRYRAQKESNHGSGQQRLQDGQTQKKGAAQVIDLTLDASDEPDEEDREGRDRTDSGSSRAVDAVSRILDFLTIRDSS